MTTEPITNADDILYIQDIKDRIEDIEQALKDDIETLDSSHFEELQILKIFLKDNESSFEYISTLIRDSYTEDWAQQEASDLFGISDTNGWPTNHIDWKSATEELLIDYKQIDFNGITYWEKES